MHARLAALLAIALCSCHVSWGEVIAPDPAEQLASLRDESVNILSRLGDLTKKSDVLSTEEGMKLLQELVDQMKDVNARIRALEATIAQQPKPAAPKFPITTPNGYIQFQFRDSDRPSARQNSFHLRRVRLGGRVQIDPQTTGRFSYELASGVGAVTGTVREASIENQRGILTLRLGQFAAPMGYEIPRSSADREMPEQSTINRTLFDSEFVVGVSGTVAVDKRLSVTGAVVNSLATYDPEQRNLAQGGPGRRQAVIGSVRYSDGRGLSVGLSGFTGVRPAFATGTTATNGKEIIAPAVRRSFVLVDASALGVWDSKIDLRGEYLFGTDRNNLGSNSASVSRNKANLNGWHALLSYRTRPNQRAFVRFEEFDPNTLTRRDVVGAMGLGYSYDMNPNTRLTAAIEWFREPAGRTRMLTLRSQIRF
ncbi:MAG: hypothetical protein JNM85_03550 [Chthonomonas sp.]|nr:hypothetical protein [Chthonomonas sp.]